MLNGQTQEAVKAAQEAYRLDQHVTITTFLAMAQAAAGNTAEAKKLAGMLDKKARSHYVCAYEVAGVHLSLGEKDKAVQWLRCGRERAVRLPDLAAIGTLDGRDAEGSELQPVHPEDRLPGEMKARAT